MISFQHITPPLRLFHGPESLGQLGRELDRVNSKRAVIFCGASLARQGTLLDVVRSAMGDRCAGVFTGVRAHSPVPSVAAAAEELKRLQADAVIAVGGGSAIVTARAASILAAEDRDVRELCTTQDAKGGLKSPKLARAEAAATRHPHHADDRRREGGQRGVRSRRRRAPRAVRSQDARACGLHRSAHAAIRAARAGGERQPEHVRHGHGRADVARRATRSPMPC